MASRTTLVLDDNAADNDPAAEVRRLSRRRGLLTCSHLDTDFFAGMPGLRVEATGSRSA